MNQLCRMNSNGEQNVFLVLFVFVIFQFVLPDDSCSLVSFICLGYIVSVIPFGCLAVRLLRRTYIYLDFPTGEFDPS